MDKLEKVIKGLECCKGHGGCRYCPYPCYCEYADDWPEQLLTDALELLKEQQKLIDEITQRRANNGAFD